MTDRKRDNPEPNKNSGVPPLGSSLPHDEPLPYRIELWDIDDSTAVERALARAVNAPLARAIYEAARKEHPERRITLRRGSRIVADSAQDGPIQTH